MREPAGFAGLHLQIQNPLAGLVEGAHPNGPGLCVEGAVRDPLLVAVAVDVAKRPGRCRTGRLGPQQPAHLVDAAQSARAVGRHHHRRATGHEPARHRGPEVPGAILDDLLELRRAAAALLGARIRRGSLDLDMPEPEFIFNSEGAVLDVRRKERLESHRLVEDFMIAANEAVGRELTRRRIPLPYRVHESPDEFKLAALSPALARFGVHVPRGGIHEQSELQAALDKAREHPAGSIVMRLVLRSLARAVYSERNVGHFGLASKCYAHFTSPIRRYPDLIVHRAVKAALGDAAEIRPGASQGWGQVHLIQQPHPLSNAQFLQSACR